MNFLVDVNIEEAMSSWLMGLGHDLLLARNSHSRTSDDTLLAIARETSRIVLTRDKDFGDLIFRDRRRALGVILIRLRAKDQFERLELFKLHWRNIEVAAFGSMVVVSNEQLRIRRLI